MKFDNPIGSTPIDSDDLAGLIPKHIDTQEELNAWESQNILEAEPWAFKQQNILNVDFIKELHKKMFDHTWTWAGKFRHTDKNIGVDWKKIPVMLKDLCDDVQYWITNKTFSPDEIAVRFHHRLVYIHPFANGNGRHARLMADLLIVKLGGLRFSWGSGQDLTKSTPVRKQYIEALQLADKGDYSKLLAFARS